MPSDKPLTEDEYLKHEAELAHAALKRLRGEIKQSLARSADLTAWTERYPFPVVGAAAVSGLSAGWALGCSFRRSKTKSEAEKTTADDNGQATPDETTVGRSATSQESHPVSRLVGGLGTLAGALGSAVIGAASEAVVDVVKETVRDTLRPGAAESPSTDDDQ